MDNPHFNVIVDGTVLDGFSAAAVLSQLQQQLKLPPAKAQALIAGKTVTVKRDVDTSVANNYCLRLRALGVNARIEPVVAAAPAPVEPPATAVQPIAHPQPAATAARFPRFEAARYFSETPLAQKEIALSASFKRALARANAALIATVAGYALFTLASFGFFIAYIAHYFYLLGAPPLFFSIPIFLIPVTMLAAVLVFIVRPLILQIRRDETGTLVSPIEDPALFAFIQQLCNALSIKSPEQIALTTSAQNKTALLPGYKNWIHGEYQLLISLPLMNNCSMAQFAGLLAADLATQSRLPALRYRRLFEVAQTQLKNCIDDRDWLSHLIFGAAPRDYTTLNSVQRLLEKILKFSNQLLAKIVSRLLRIERRLQRPLAYEMDRYCALIAGSAQFTELMILNARLQTATADAQEKNLEDRPDSGLVDDLPALINHYIEGLDDNFNRNLQRKWQAETTPRRADPPIMRERLEQIAANNYSGIIASEQNASSLLKDSAEFARRTTLKSYQAAKLIFDVNKLIPVDRLMYAATQDMLQKQQAAVYFNDWFKPFRFWILADYKLIGDMPLQDAAMQLSVCVNEIRRLTPDREKLFAEYDRLHNQLRELLIAQHVIAAGKKFAFRYCQYDGTTLAPLLEEKQRDIGIITDKLTQQETVMGGRITLGLHLSGQDEREIRELHDAMRLMHDSGPRLYKLSLDCYQLEQLSQRHHQLREADYSLPIKKLETKIDDASTLLLVKLKDIPYPLDRRHASLKSFVETALLQPHRQQGSIILLRAQRMIEILYRVNEKLSRQAADFGTIAEEAYQIEPIRLINKT